MGAVLLRSRVERAARPDHRTLVRRTLVPRTYVRPEKISNDRNPKPSNVRNGWLGVPRHGITNYSIFLTLEVHMLSNVRTRTSVFHTLRYKLWNTDCSNVRDKIKFSELLTLEI